MKNTDDDENADETQQIAIRLPVALLDRLTAHAERLKRANAGKLGVTRADAIRDSLTVGLDEIESRDNASKRK